MMLKIVQNDISLMKTDAVVNAANPQLRNGGGVTGAIFAEAGAEVLGNCTRKIAPVAAGEAVITPGFDLPAKYIIHAVGPIYHGGTSQEAELLRNCYDEALKLAKANSLKSIAFPLISAGIYGYPESEAMEIALTAFLDYLKDHDLEIVLVLFTAPLVKLAEEVLERLTHGKKLC